MRLHRGGGFRNVPHRLCIVEIGKKDAFHGFQELTGIRLVGRPIKPVQNNKEGILFTSSLCPRKDDTKFWSGWCLIGSVGRWEDKPVCFRLVKVKLVPWRKR